MSSEEKTYTEAELLEKLARYCTYQERCEAEVRKKLFDLKASSQQVESIVDKLSSDRFINEERYAKVIAGSKFRIKRWGKYKIIQYLRTKRISEQMIYKALNEAIDGRLR